MEARSSSRRIDVNVNVDGGGTDDGDDDDGDVYEELRDFERMMDDAIDDILCSGGDDGGGMDDRGVGGDRGGGEDGDDDSDDDDVARDGEGDVGGRMTMTLLPPPASWFDDDDDDDDGGRKRDHRHPDNDDDIIARGDERRDDVQLMEDDDKGFKSNASDNVGTDRGKHRNGTAIGVVGGKSSSSSSSSSFLSSHHQRRRRRCHRSNGTDFVDEYDNNDHGDHAATAGESSSSMTGRGPPSSTATATTATNIVTKEDASDSVFEVGVGVVDLSRLRRNIPLLLSEMSYSATYRSEHLFRRARSGMMRSSTGGLGYVMSLSSTSNFTARGYGGGGDRRGATDMDDETGRGYTVPKIDLYECDDDECDGGTIHASILPSGGASMGVGGGGVGRRDDRVLDGVRFTSLPWIERQLVREWRTYDWRTGEEDRELSGEEMEAAADDDNEDSLDATMGGDDEYYYDPVFDRRRRWRRPDGSSLDDIEEDDDGEGDDNDNGDEALFDTTMEGNDECCYDNARTMAPRPLPRPQWENASSCYTCRKSFGHTLHRHHCRRCGHSYCNAHSSNTHPLPHLGYDVSVPERVCHRCKSILDDSDLEERVLWRMARCRDYLRADLTPYFDTGIDTVEDAACRLARLAISLARTIPLGVQAFVAIETAEVLRKHGLKGVYGLLLRREFLAAADLLCRVLGINKTNWPLSVHELSAAIFYALAQHRAMRGLRPDGEDLIHSLRPSIGDGDDSSLPPQKEGEEEEEGQWTSRSNDGDSMRPSNPPLPVLLEDATVDSANDDQKTGDPIVSDGCSRKFLAGEFSESVLDETDIYDPAFEKVVDVLAMSAAPKRITSSSGRRKDDAAHSHGNGNINASDDATHGHDATAPSKLPFDPVCEHVPDTLISSLLFFAPLALDFIYAENEVDMQLLAAQQGWRLIYACLDQNHHHVAHAGDNNDLNGNDHFSDRPACALFAHDEHKIACLSIRGTATIQDVVTDIRATPVPFPQQQDEEEDEDRNGEWTPVFRGSGLALCGMAGASYNLFRETADSLLYLALHGYKIRIVGHSLGGGVAALLGIYVLRHFEKQCTDATKSSSDSISINEDGFVRVYSYGTPSCVDSTLADHPRILELCTSVVLHG